MPTPTQTNRYDRHVILPFEVAEDEAGESLGICLSRQELLLTLVRHMWKSMVHATSNGTTVTQRRLISQHPHYLPLPLPFPSRASGQVFLSLRYL